LQSFLDAQNLPSRGKKLKCFLHINFLEKSVMRDALGAAKLRLAREIDSNSALPSKPIAADPCGQQFIYQTGRPEIWDGRAK
jgi:hypothetical protein